MSGRGGRLSGGGDRGGGGGGGRGRGTGGSGPPESRPGDWKCQSCSFNNYARNNDCHRCHVPRSGGGSGGSSGPRGGQSGSRPAGGSTQAPASRPGDWTCGGCSGNNYARNSECFRCKKPKSGDSSGGSGRGDGLTQSFQRMNVQDSGPSGRGRGSGGGGGGQSSFGGRGGGGGGGSRGRGRTVVEFPSRPEPACLQNFLAKYQATRDFYGWNKNFTSDRVDPKAKNMLPLRKKDSGVPNSTQIASIKLNHYEVKIKLPKFIYQYKVTFVRRRVSVGEGGDDKKDKPGPSTSTEMKPEASGGGGGKKKGKGKRKSQQQQQQPKPGPSNAPDPPPDPEAGAAAAQPEERLLPKFLRKAILKCLVQRLHTDPRYGYEYGVITDFSELVYTKKRLEEAQQGLVFQVNGNDAIGPEDADSIFTVTLAPTDGTIDTTALQTVINNMQGVRITREMENLEKVYSTLMRCLRLSVYTPMRRADLINYNAPRHDLGGGIVSYPGFNIMLPITNGWKPFINIEMANMASYMDGEVTHILENLLGNNTPANDVTQWRPWQIEEATKHLRTCKIVYSPDRGRSKTFSKVVVRVLPTSVSDTKFTIEGANYQTSVFQYFNDAPRNHRLQHPKGPCLELKGGNSPKVPVELCRLKAGQSFNRKLDENQVTRMADVAKRDPSDGVDRITRVFKTGLHTEINRAIGELQLTNNPLLDAYGINMTSPNKDKMHEIKARVLAAPELCYGKETGTTDNSKRARVTPADGEWDIWQHDFEFFEIGNVKYWGVLNLENRMREDDIWDFADKLSRKAAKRNITIPDPILIDHCTHLRERGANNVNELTKRLEKFKIALKGDMMSFVLVILPKKGSDLYNDVKQAAELKVGILTQCIVEKNAKDLKKLDSIVGNILLKINSKLNKVNHIVAEPPKFPGSFKIFDLPVMIIGADVTHPPPGMAREGGGGPPSYAAVTASIDRTCMPYMMHVEAQAKADRGAAEVITGLERIVISFLQTYSTRTGGYKPVKIIYFRDGVGDGQFQEVLRTEMSAIRRACTAFDKEGYEPKITFITVQKRHKTRFFLNDNGRISNAAAGTVVDSDIVHPVENDFFLLSHKGLMGTSRPTRYHILWDDSDFAMNEIQTLAYFLCYMFVRCNRSVKLPAPTYYSHWAAKRAEVLAKGWGEQFYGDLPALNAQLRRRETQNNFGTNFPMHFV